MGLIFRSYLSGDKVYSCSTCKCHLATVDGIISKAFQGRHGRAYLFDNVVNVSTGKKEERLLITGMHTVADIHCNICDTVLGWKYLDTEEESQKYKVGHYIIEKAKMIKEAPW